VAAVKALLSESEISNMPSPEPGQNYFELFGLNAAFDIDPAELHTRQQRLQAAYHPDRHVASSEQQKRVSVQMASWINQAYETLRDPVKRSRYLLEISGASLPDDSATTADASFLMEQMELREAVDSCRQAQDGLERCEAIAGRLRQRADELAREFVERFTTGEIEAAIDASRKMQFVQRIQQQLDELQFELEDI